MRLDVSEMEALRRIAARAGGRHLTDGLKDNQRVWTAFHERVVPDSDVDLVIDTDVVPSDAVVRAVTTALAELGTTLT